MEEVVDDEKDDNTKWLDEGKEAKGPDMTPPDDTEGCVDGDKNENIDDDKETIYP